LNPNPIIRAPLEPGVTQPPALKMIVGGKKRVNFAPSDPLKGTEW